MESRRKEVLLLILAVAALGVGLYTFRGKSSAPAPGPAPRAEKAAPSGEEKAGEPAASAKEGQKPAAEGEGKTSGGAASAQRNPFSAPGGPAPGAEQPVSGGEGAQPAQPAQPVQPVPVQEPAQVASGGAGMVLTGIVDGKQTLAILRQDDRRFYVKVGDSVGDGYRVQSIGSQQVVLAGQQGKLILKMGGRQ